MPKKDLVSICIPVYNAEAYIVNAINSVLRQSYNNIEIVVVDNCSTDATVEKVEAIGSERIKIFRNETNIGYPRNVNRCLDNAGGEYITILCADDYFLSETILEDWVNALKLHPQCVAVHSAFTHPNWQPEFGDFQFRAPQSDRPRSILSEGINNPLKVLQAFQSGSGFFGWGWLLKADLVRDQALSFDAELTMAPDTLFWLQLCCAGPTYEMPRSQPAYAFVVHGDSLGSRLFKDYWNNVVLELEKFEIKLSQILNSKSVERNENLRISKFGVYTANESICILKNNYVKGNVGFRFFLKFFLRILMRYRLSCFNKRFILNFGIALLPRVLAQELLSRRR